MTRAKKLLVAGIGNIFFGDDAFGCEVVKLLTARDWPAGVRVRDFGIRGVDLAYELLEGYDAVILIDAAPVGHQAGDLAVIEPTAGEVDDDGGEAGWDSHSMNPVNVLRMARRMGASWGRMLLVGCQPAQLNDQTELTTSDDLVTGDDDIASGLSQAVSQAIEPAANLVASLVDELLADETPRRVSVAPSPSATPPS